MSFELTAPNVNAVLGSLAGSTLGLSTQETANLGERTRIDDDLGADSLNLMELATHVSRFFRLHETGLEDDLLRRRSIGDWTGTVLKSWKLSERKRISFLTSGSTGQPKECAHDWSSLEQEVRELARLVAGRARIVSTVPRHHIYGFLWTVLLPSYLGVPFLEARQMLPGGLIRSLRWGDLLVSFPMRWSQIAQSGLDFPPAVEGVTSTGPCPPGLAADLRALSLERLVEVYGSSETGGIGWREDPAEPYRLFPYWELADDERLVRCLPDGRRSTPISAPDHLLRQPGGFALAGRRDDAVQVGGVNVFPHRVAEVIRSHPDVADCAVRAMRPGEGQRLKAFVVLESEARQEADDVLQRLRRWMGETLDTAELPTSLTLGPEVPRDAQGKARDWA